MAQDQQAGTLTASAHEAGRGLAAPLGTAFVVGAATALIEPELLAGLALGVAAMLVPRLFSSATGETMGGAIRPLLKSTVRAAYLTAAKTRELAAEASEQFQDIVAEVKAEETGEEGEARPHGEEKRAQPRVAPQPSATRESRRRRA